MKIQALIISATLLVGLGACSTNQPEKPVVTADRNEIVGQQIEQYLDGAQIKDEVTTSSGLIYHIVKPGSLEHPTVNDEVTINYRGYTVDGRVFDQTTGSPRTFPLNRLIAAWQEAIPLIGRGGEIKIIAPPSTAYGNNPPPGSGIAAGDVLVFDVELIDFK